MRHMFEQSRETTELLTYFKAMSIQKPISFEAASKGVGFLITSRLSSYQSARRIAEREHGIVIEGIKKFGFVRLSGDKIVDQGDRGARSIRTRAKREALKQQIAIGQNLDQQHMSRATELLGRFRIIADTASPAKSNKPVVEKPEVETQTSNGERLRIVKP